MAKRFVALFSWSACIDQPYWAIWGRLKALLHSLWRHQFFTLSSGVVAAQLLSLALMPLLTRLYPVQSFGYFAIYMAIANLVGAFATLRLELTIPLATDQAEADQISSLTLAMVILAGLFAAGISLFPSVRQLLPAMEQTLHIWLLTALSATLIGLTQILNQRLLRNGQLKYTAMRHIFDKAAFIICAIWAAKTNHTAGGLIVAQTIGNLAAILTLLLGSTWLPKFSWRSMRHLAAKYSDFPKLNTTSVALQLLAAQLPVLLYSNYFPPAAIGHLNLAQRLAEAPNTIVTSALGPAYYRRLLSATRDQYRRIFRRSILWSLLFFFAPALVFSFFAGPVITFVFGVRWESSSLYFLAILPFTISRVIYMLQQAWFVILRRLDIDLKIAALVLSTQAIGLFTGIYYFDTLFEPVLLASLLTASVYVFCLFIIYRLIANAVPTR